MDTSTSAASGDEAIDCKAEGSVVWVRVKNSKLWWVGTVVTDNYPEDILGRTRITPVAIVKYFPIPPASPEAEEGTNGDDGDDQDEYEVVRKEQEILFYQSDKKEDLIRKGKVHLAKNQEQLERFIRDCKKAETLTGGKESFVDTVSTTVQHLNKSNIWAEICKPAEAPAPPKTPVTKTPPGRPSSLKRKRGPGTPVKRARPAPVSDKKYSCQHCSFATDRLTAFTTHVKSHPGPSNKTISDAQEKAVGESSDTKIKLTPKGTPKAEASQQKSTPKTRGRKRKPPKEQAKQEILADWEEEEKDENADSDAEDLPPVLEAKKPRSAVDLFDSLFKNRSPEPESTEGDKIEVPESKYRRKDSEDTHSDLDSSEESENILKAVGPTSDRKDSLSEADLDDLPPPELDLIVKDPLIEKAKSKSRSPEPQKSPRNKSVEPEIKTPPSKAKDETPKSNNKTPTNSEPRRSSRRPADLPSKYKDEDVPVTPKGKRGVGRPRKNPSILIEDAPEKEPPKKEVEEHHDESDESPTIPKKEATEPTNTPKEKINDIPLSSTIESVAPETLANTTKEIPENSKSREKQTLPTEIPQTSTKVKEVVTPATLKSPNKEPGTPEIFPAQKKVPVTQSASAKKEAQAPAKAVTLIPLQSPTKKQTESPVKKIQELPKSPVRKIPEPTKSPTTSTPQPPKSPVKKTPEPPKSPVKKIPEPPKSPVKKIPEPPTSPTKNTPEPPKSPAKKAADLPRSPKKQIAEPVKIEGKSSPTKMDPSSPVRRASIPGVQTSPILVTGKPNVVQIKSSPAKQQAEKLIILPQSNASSSPGTTTYKIIQQGLTGQSISLQPQQPQTQQIIYLTQPTQGIAAATTASQQVQYILNQNQMIPILTSATSTPNTAATAVKKTPVQVQPSKNIANPILSTASSSTTPATASALVKKAAKPTATIKPNPVAEEKPKASTTTKQDEIVTDKVVHLLPVENHDGSVTYMFVSLDEKGGVKIDSAEGPRLPREEPHIFVDKPTEPKKLLSALTRNPTPTTPAILQQKKSAIRKPPQATTTPTQPKIIRAPPATAAAQVKLAAAASVVQSTASSLIQQQPLNELTRQILTQQIQEPVVSPVSVPPASVPAAPIPAAKQTEIPVDIQDIQIPAGSVVETSDISDGTTMLIGEGEEQQYYTIGGEFDVSQQYVLQDQVGEGLDFSQLSVDGDTIYLLQEDGTLIHPSAVGLNLSNLNQLTLGQDTGSQQ